MKLRSAGTWSALLMFAAFLAPATSAQTYAITGAKIHTLAGPPIPSGTVVIRDGKIAAVGANVSVPSGAQVINAKGLEVYPGLFNAISQIGLVEVGQGEPGTVDTSELGDYNPQVVAAMALHVESEHIPVVRANGITHAMSVPGLGPGVIGGQSSIIYLAGWSIDEMLVRRSAAMVLNWPTLGGGRGGFGGGGGFGGARRQPFNELRQAYERRVEELTNWMDRARHYAQAVERGSKDNFERDLKLEALVPVVKGELPLLVIANDDRDIKNAVEFCEKQKLKMILGGGREAWKVKELLKQKNVPVILGASQELPSAEDEPYDRPLSVAGELHTAGVKVAIATFGYQFARTLPYEAGNTVAYGLPWEEALKAITLYPAQMFGLDKQLGSIEQGKIANLIVTNGDPLELRTEVKHLFINGRPTSLENKHQQLWEKYKARP